MKPVCEYRDEQMRAVEILRRKVDILPGYIKTEYPVEGLVWDGKKIGCTLDIAIVPPSVQYKIAIRLMGEIHTKKRNIPHDDDQKSALIKEGWTVIDFIDEYMPNLWSKKRSPEIDLLSEKEVIEAIA